MKASELPDDIQALVFHDREEGDTKTVAFLLPKKTEKPFETMYYSVAHCNPTDQFNRKIGRDIAIGRALTKMTGDTVKHAYSLKIKSDFLYESGGISLRKAIPQLKNLLLATRIIVNGKNSIPKA